MGFISDVKDLTSREAVQSYAKKIKKDVIAMFWENKFNFELIQDLLDSPAFIREQLFLVKLEKNYKWCIS